VGVFVTLSSQHSQPENGSETITQMVIYNAKHMFTIEAPVWSDGNIVKFIDLFWDNWLL
jgi:hypothetical protein